MLLQFYLLCGAFHMFFMVVENDYPVQFEYTGFRILINTFATNHGYWQMCVEYILARSALSSDHKKVTTDLMLTYIKNNIFLLISIRILAKVLFHCYLEHIETLVVIYWNLYMSPKC